MLSEGLPNVPGMNLTVLAASGQTGIALTRQALRRGHTVTAIARDPGRIALPDSPNL
ncbi:NAD(P)H-binding protein, partial [Streptomyces sp. NPDC058678]|uniref:NAD(P)H-binding protein n=1 Tax=Streptomyces sp. NPDC058678 TaxID=3346595 RepID=UPI003648CCF9